MATIMRMPELAANTPEATLVEWLVKEGGRVNAGDAIATVETAKAIVDIEAEVGGVVLRLTVEDGTDVQVGHPIAVIGADGERVDETQLGDGPVLELERPAEIADAAAAAPALPATQTADAPSAPAAEVVATRDATSSGQGTPSVVRAADPGRRIFASPLARKLAKDAGLELANVSGSGPNGRIRRRDIDAAVATRERLTSAKPATIATPPAPAAPTAAAPQAVTDWADVPHTKLRRVIAARLTESKQSAPHFYVRGTAKVDALLDLRKRLNEETGERISVNDLILKAVAKAHRAVSRMNVVWGADAIRQFDHVDIAVAVATEQGLVTPVVHKVDTLSLSALAAATRDYAERARTGKLRPDELDGGTISVSNLGMFGTEEFSAIINPPQASILAVGSAVPRAVVVDGEVTIARTLNVTLSVDHRPVDGAVAAEWMREFVDLLEQPLRLLA